MLFFLGLELSENLEKIDPNFLNLNVKDQGNVLLCGYQINLIFSIKISLKMLFPT